MEIRLKQVQNDYAKLSNRPAQEELHPATAAAGVTRACVARGSVCLASRENSWLKKKLADAERRAQGEKLHRLVHQKLVAKAKDALTHREREMELTMEELDVARNYAASVKGLLIAVETGVAAHAEVREELFKVDADVDVKRLKVTVLEMKDEARKSTGDFTVLRRMWEEQAGDLNEAERRREEAVEEATVLRAELDETGEALRRTRVKLGGDIDALEWKLRGMKVSAREDGYDRTECAVDVCTCVCVYLCVVQKTLLYVESERAPYSCPGVQHVIAV